MTFLRRNSTQFLCGLCVFALVPDSIPAQEWPTLPDANAAIVVPAQEWAFEPAPRTVNAYLHYPNGSIANVDANTGLMLSLHNWGGTHATGAPDPDTLADRYNVIAICVDYLQSGKWNPETNHPYDFGYLQALDALRSLYAVWSQLDAREIAFDKARIYAAGGSGGGNVALMANKLAPRTFAAIVNLSGMVRLTDDIAFGLEGGSDLNAGYSNDPKSPRFLSKDDQELRFIGNPDHLVKQVSLGNKPKVIVVHGANDDTCPTADTRQMVDTMIAAGMDVDAHIVEESDIDGEIFTDTKHSLGDRTKIVLHLAGKYLQPDSPEAARRSIPADFDRKDRAVRYPTPRGVFIISYENGYPQGRFERNDRDPSDQVVFP
ncbi:MAG: hypothetical protein AMXMBFR84_15080 [Candidatus Hydrogenedentota bacterium]